MAPVLKNMPCHQLIKSQDTEERGALAPQPTRGSKQRCRTRGVFQQWAGVAEGGYLPESRTLTSCQPCLPFQPEQQHHCRILLETTGTAPRNLKTTVTSHPSISHPMGKLRHREAGSFLKPPDKSVVQKGQTWYTAFPPSTTCPFCSPAPLPVPILCWL